MQLLLDGVELKSPFLMQPRRAMDDDEFLLFCSQHPDLRIERTAKGDLLIMPPAGDESGYQSLEVAGELRSWAKRDGRGQAFDSSAGFLLPNGACRAADAAWVLRSRLQKFTKQQRRKFLPLCPDFVVEVFSPTDRLPQLKSKMREWIENGAQLAWLLDPDRRTAYIYRPGREAERLVNLQRLVGEPPVGGFILDLHDIWAGL